MAVIIDGGGQPVNITVAASGVVVCPVASILTGGGGGGGGVTDHGALTGLADDDHTQYHTDARGDARYSQLGHNHDHGNLTGLSDDDHPQYLNNSRGDVRYAAINHSHAASAITVTASGFNGNLSPTDTNVQSALQKLDDLTVSVSGNLTGIDSISTPDWIQFDTAPAGTDAVGRLRWSTTTNTLNLGINSNITLPVGQQLIQEVMNNDGTAIAKGDVVYVLGASGNRLSVAKAKADVEATCSKTFGVALEAISNNQTGYVLTYGLVKGLNTNALQEGYAVWLSASVAGGLTTTRPTAPNHGVLIGFCVRQQSVNGELFVAITNGHELDELHNVNASSPASGDVLGFDSASHTWIPTQRVSTTDSRLTDARTPTAHAASHAASGTDAITIANTQVTGLGGAATLSVGTSAGTVAAGDDSRITGAAQKASNLSDLTSTSTARTNLGLGGAATLNVGTSAGTVAAGNDSRITGAAQKASNLSDLSSASTARTNLGLGGAATLSVGTTAGTVAAGDDSRITGAIQSSLVDAKGDLLVGTANDTVARLPVGTNNYVLTADSTTTEGVKWAVSGGVTDLMPIYGKGSDGDVTIPSGTTVLSGDAYYNNLTVTGTLVTAGYRVFVAGTLSGSGIIQTPVVAAANQSGGIQQQSNDQVYLRGGTGGAGAIGAVGGASAALGSATRLGANGGTGGTGTSGAGGVGTTTPINSVSQGGANLYQDLVSMLYSKTPGSLNGRVGGGNGGGAGGGDATNAGAGGGHGGGVCFVAARAITFTGAINAIGGSGCFRTAGNVGGGGGGGGGVVVVVTGSATQTFTISVAGGSGGAGNGTGTAGSSGSAGVSAVFLGAK